MEKFLGAYETLSKPYITTNPFPIVIIDNFLDNQTCDLLIEEASKATPQNRYNVMGGRFILPWTSKIFQDVAAPGTPWEKFRNNFPQDCLSTFISLIKSHGENNSLGTKWLKNKNLILKDELYSLSSKVLSKSMYLKYKRGLDSPCRLLSFKRHLFYAFVGLLDDLYREIMGTIEYIRNSRSLVPLFEYNLSIKGYKREVHRDTDSRAFVVLLYLNSLEDGVSGGNIRLYRSLKDRNKKSWPPQPAEDEIEKILTVEPKAGRLVMFINTPNSYHDVEEMSYTSTGRHFVYGGFTQQSGLGSPARKDSSSRFPTNYKSYR